MYFSNSSTTGTAPVIPDAPVRAKLRLADLLGCQGVASNSEVFSTIPRQSVVYPNLLIQTGGRTTDAMRGCVQHGQPTCDPMLHMFGQPQPHTMLLGQQVQGVHDTNQSTLSSSEVRLNSGSIGSRCQTDKSPGSTPGKDATRLHEPRSCKHGNDGSKEFSTRGVLPPGRVHKKEPKGESLIPSREEASILPQRSARDVAHSFADDVTTVMLRNIPLRYITEELLHEFILAGFEDKFDFFYLPIDFRTKRNRGYCFLNFTSANNAKDFVHSFHGMHLTRYSTKKILEVAPADTQGLEANSKKYMNQRVTNPWFRPMFFGESCDGDDAADDAYA